MWTSVSEKSVKGGPDPHSQPDVTSYGGAVDDMEFCLSFAKLSFKQAAALESLDENHTTSSEKLTKRFKTRR